MGRPSQRLAYLLSSAADYNEIEGIGGTRRRSIDSKWLTLKFQRPTAGVKIQMPCAILRTHLPFPGRAFNDTRVPHLHRASSLVDI